MGVCGRDEGVSQEQRYQEGGGLAWSLHPKRKSRFYGELVGGSVLGTLSWSFWV